MLTAADALNGKVGEAKMDREKVIAGLTMLLDRKNDDTCEGLKCCKIAEDALVLLKEHEETIYKLQKELNYWQNKGKLVKWE